MTNRTAGAAPVLVFDGDCGFCSSSARLARRMVDRRGRYAVVEQYQLLDLPALGLTTDQCGTSSWFVTADGERFAGAASIAAALRFGAPGWRPLGLLLSAPGVRTVADVAYRWVAANRFRLPGGTPACRVNAAASSPADD